MATTTTTISSSVQQQQQQQQAVIDASPAQSNSMSAHSFLTSCTASDLADCLLDRFGNCRDAACEFLRACQKAVENKATASLPQEETKDDVLGESLLVKPVVLSMISPRGKVSVDFFDGGYLQAVDVKSSTVSWRLDASQVAQVVVFPKPEDCKKDLSKKSADVVLLHLKSPLTVKNQKKPVQTVSFCWPTTELPEWKTAPSTAVVPDTTLAWNQVLQRVVKSDCKILRVQHPQAAAPSAFCSYTAHGVSTTSAGMPFVTCYHGTKDGVLYPLTDGSLLFYKPPFLIPSHRVDGITTGGRGAANSRYVDVLVQMQKRDDDDDNMEPSCYEFTNVNREEVEGLTKFLALAGEEAADESVDDYDDEEDQDATCRNIRKRSKRKASVEARRINKRIVVGATTAEDEEDEEDDIEYIAGTAAENEDEEMDDEDDEGDSDEGEDEDMGDDSEEEHDEAVDQLEIEGEETEDETESEG